jgi:hypothetical protein
MTAQGLDDAIVAYRSGGPIRIRDIEVEGSPAKHGISIAGQPLSQIRREVTRYRRIGLFGRCLALTRVSQGLDMPERLGDRRS